MKAYRHIKAAEEFSFGTIFYSVTEDELKRYYKDNGNIFTKYLVQEEGFKAFDLDRMYGSAVIGDTLYICETDGSFIEVNGEEVEPEFALEDYTIEDLEPYIQELPEKDIKNKLGNYELADFDINDVSTYLIADEGYEFFEVIDALKDLDLLDEYIK